MHQFNLFIVYFCLFAMFNARGMYFLLLLFLGSEEAVRSGDNGQHRGLSCVRTAANHILASGQVYVSVGLSTC
jgi:hypothetical protein